jgi:selenocysteine lyase/cysteine desulfurase
MKSASVTYAMSLYQQTVKELGPRDAYAMAIKTAQLTATERTALREMITASSWTPSVWALRTASDG